MTPFEMFLVIFFTGCLAVLDFVLKFVRDMRNAKKLLAGITEEHNAAVARLKAAQEAGPDAPVPAPRPGLVLSVQEHMILAHIQANPGCSYVSVLEDVPVWNEDGPPLADSMLRLAAEGLIVLPSGWYAREMFTEPERVLTPQRIATLAAGAPMDPSCFPEEKKPAKKPMPKHLTLVKE